MEVQFFKTTVIPHHMAPSDEQEALMLMELCGRCAYKSEEKITRDSAKTFVLMLKNRGHLSVLEHSNVVLKIIPFANTKAPKEAMEAFRIRILSAINERSGFHRIYLPTTGAGLAVAGNFRGWLETLDEIEAHDPALHTFFRNGLFDHFPSIFSAGEKQEHNLPITLSLMKENEQMEALRADIRSDLPVFIFKFICDRGITHEVVRHRVFSFTQESTRYVNYKNRGMTLILPEELEPCFNEQSGTLREGSPIVELWKERSKTIFQWYRDDLERGLKPQIARDVLPNLLKSEIYVSGRWSGWQHFIELRDSPAAHPRIRAMAGKVRAYFQELGLTVAAS